MHCGKEEKSKADYQDPSVIEHSRTAPPLETISPKRDKNPRKMKCN